MCGADPISGLFYKCSMCGKAKFVHLVKLDRMPHEQYVCTQCCNLHVYRHERITCERSK